MSNGTALTTSVYSGFEQANRYVILDAQGNHAGYMAEQEQGLGKMMARQWFNTHRSFITHVFDKHQNEVLRVSVISPIQLRCTDSCSFTDRSPGSIRESAYTIPWR